MYFSTVALTTLLGLASAQKIHVVSVSSTNKDLTFSPNNIQAAVGEMVQFQFISGNHSVVQSNFDNPCEPITLHNASAAGMFSGYMDVAAGESTGMSPVYTMMISATTPVWLYCSQGKHCQAGMTMVINEK
ncbi:Cupredoxin [Xylariaceae sp. FL1272]|nr:Cupredoxin [Xylariaceae sp. FL1272]